jgi:hypothetical protein
VYRYLEQVARLTHLPLERVVAQSIAGNLPPASIDVPSELQAQPAELQAMDVDRLQAEVGAEVPESQQARHRALLEKNSAGTITPAERIELEQLRTDADVLMVRKAYAAAVLRWLGEPDPVPGAGRGSPPRDRDE